MASRSRSITVLMALGLVLAAVLVFALRPQESPVPEPDSATGTLTDLASDPAPEYRDDPIQLDSRVHPRNVAGDALPEVLSAPQQSQSAVFESALFRDATLYLWVFHNLVASDDYYAMVDSFRARTDAASIDFYSEVRTVLEQHPWILSGRVAISNIGCAPRFCLVTITGQSVSELEVFPYGSTDPEGVAIPGSSFTSIKVVPVPTGGEIRMLVGRFGPSYAVDSRQAPED